MLQIGGDQGSFELHMDALKLTKEVCECIIVIVGKVSHYF